MTWKLWFDSTEIICSDISVNQPIRVLIWLCWSVLAEKLEFQIYQLSFDNLITDIIIHTCSGIQNRFPVPNTEGFLFFTSFSVAKIFGVVLLVCSFWFIILCILVAQNEGQIVVEKTKLVGWASLRTFQSLIAGNLIISRFTDVQNFTCLWLTKVYFFP